MNITVLKVNVQEVQGAKGPYKTAELVYKSDDKVKTHKVVSWNKDVFALVSTVVQGDVLDVTFEKDAKNYWQMTRATKVGKEDVGATSAPPAKGNWETSDERAAKQVYIVRQNSIGNAVAYLEATKGKAFSVDDVKAVAADLTDFVFGQQQPKHAPIDRLVGDVE